MINNDEIGPIDSGILKELYLLSEQYEDSDLARDILRTKGKKIKPSNISASVCSLSPNFTTDMQVFSSIISTLSMEGFSASNSHYEPVPIASMSESAEKEYLLALLALRNGKNETQRLEALRHVSSALASEPNDPRFQALAAVLQQA